MFTGIITEVGTIHRAENRPDGLDLTIQCGYPDLELGESIAVDGACLTVTFTSFALPWSAPVLPSTGRAALSISSGRCASETVSVDTSFRDTSMVSGK
jgi:riboflavin synthase alpha subunit